MTGVALAVLSVGAYALAAVSQRCAAPGPGVPFRPGAAVARRRAWWIGLALFGAGAALHAAALRYGDLVVVQALGALTLVLALPLDAATNRRKVTRREMLAAVAVVGGLAGLIATLGAAASPPAETGTLTGAEVAMAAAATAAGVTLLAVGPRRAGRALRLAAVSGTTSGTASALGAVVAVRLGGTGGDGATAGSTVAVAGAVAVLGVAGLLLSQAAYRGGLGAPLAVATVANPATAALVSGDLLDGQALSVAATAVAVVAAVSATAGVAILARSGDEPALVPPLGDATAATRTFHGRNRDVMTSSSPSRRPLPGDPDSGSAHPRCASYRAIGAARA
jgi:hypothetical protein